MLSVFFKNGLFNLFDQYFIFFDYFFYIFLQSNILLKVLFEKSQLFTEIR